MERNQTAHIFTHFTKHSMAQQRVPLKAFVLGHRDWIESVGGDLLHRKGRTVDQYIADLIRPGFKFDELALLICTRMHHKHIFVLMEGRFWTSHMDNDVTRCDLKFGFVGNLLFVPLMHESVHIRKFKDGTRAVNIFLRPRPERRVKSKPRYSINLSQECIDVITGNVTRNSPGEKFVPDELPCEELPPSAVGVQHTLIDESSFMPKLVNSDGEVMKFDPMHCNDAVTRESDQSADDLSAVTSSYPIGTAEIIMPSVTEGNDIPIGSTADGINVKEESLMSTDGQNSENENSVDIVPITRDVVQSPQNLGSASANSEVPHEGSMAPGSNEIPESAVSSQEKPQNAGETVDYTCDNRGLVSDALDSNTDKVLDTSTELGEGSETNVPEQTVDIETEMPQNQSDINKEAHIGTEPNIPDDSVNAEPVPNEVQDNEQQTIEKPVSTEVGDNKKETSDQNKEDSASNVDFEVQKEKSVPPADDTDQNGTSSDSNAEDSVVDQNGTSSDRNAEDSAVDIDSEPDNIYCSCGTSCSCSSSSSSSSSNEDQPPKRGKRKYSDAETCNSTDSDVPKRKLRRYVSGSKPNYKVDSSDNDNDSDPNYSGNDSDPDKTESYTSDPDKTESYTSEEEIVVTKTQTTKKKIITTKSGQIEIKHFKLKSKKIRKRTYKCKYCGNISKTQKDHNNHVKTDHKDCKFICFHCDRTFDSDNALYKHERSHYNLPYGCSNCDRRFQFPYQVKAHMKVHTQKNLYKCLHCERSFTTNLSMKTHAKTHFEKFTCPHKQCSTPDKVYNSKGNLQQHIRGEHGQGWTAFCGEKIKWKSKYNRHIKNCLECLKIKKQKVQKRYHFM